MKPREIWSLKMMQGQKEKHKQKNSVRCHDMSQYCAKPTIFVALSMFLSIMTGDGWGTTMDTPSCVWWGGVAFSSVPFKHHRNETDPSLGANWTISRSHPTGKPWDMCNVLIYEGGTAKLKKFGNMFGYQWWGVCFQRLKDHQDCLFFSKCTSYVDSSCC